MKETIRKIDLNSEYYISEGCHIIEMSNSPDDPELSIARARVLPGVVTQWHRLKGTAERYVILEGVGEVEVGDLAPQEVTVGDVVLIPPMCAQRISNIGGTDLVFLAICCPRFEVSAYETIEGK
ncbi:MAG: cupin [Gammaproteobacteria bacterium]|nr:MAG: cupin [Gammaproteobacteria bacterium]